MPKPDPNNETVLNLIAQPESFATALQLIALALDTLPKEQAGAIAANATEIRVRMVELRIALRLLGRWGKQRSHSTIAPGPGRDCGPA
jgi:hypothetical protein